MNRKKILSRFALKGIQSGLLKKLMCFGLLSLCFNSLPGQISLPDIYQDHMVLQRDKENQIVGTAEAGKMVSLSFDDQQYTTIADENGRFTFLLKGLPLSVEPHTMTITCGSSTVEIKDVLVGDVFLLGGQSNMAFMVKELAASALDAIRADADYPLIRYYTVAKYNGNEEEMKDKPWIGMSAESAPECSAVGFYFARKLYQEKRVPVGLINCSRGSSNAESWISADYIDSHPELRPYLTGASNSAETTHRTPGILYEKMLRRALPYSVCGVLWYQGEANAKVYQKYGKVLPAVIDCFRKTFRDDTLPFVLVQLSAFKNAPCFWPYIREVQDSVASVTPHTLMVSSIDAGATDNIHPLKKEPVGLRCASAIRHLVYGDEIEYSGPTFQSIRIENGKAVVTFGHADGLHSKGNIVDGFEICDDSYVYQVATNVEISGSEVKLWNTSIEEPVAVRYAWSNYPLPNLYNSAGMPANPFRTSSQSPQLPVTVFFVTPDGCGEKTGADWDNAAPLNTNTLKKGKAGDEFWVKGGVYHTTVEFSDRKVYGGFNGTETALEERNWQLYPIVIQGKNNATNALVRMESNALLDGFILQDNHLTKSSFRNGAGVQMGEKTTLRNCVVRNNKTIGAESTNIGGGVFILGSEQDGISPMIENCLIINNSAPNNGGGIQVTANGALHIVGSTIANNLLVKKEGVVGSGYGCGIGLAPNTRLIVENCILYNNCKPDAAGSYLSFSIGTNYNTETNHAIIVRHCAFDAVYAGHDNMEGVVFAEKTACIDDLSTTHTPAFKQPTSFVGPVLSTNSRYAEFSTADFSLSLNSNCIDAGNSIYSRTEKDLLCNSRIVGDNVDVGAYENQSSLDTGMEIIRQSFNCFVENGCLVVTDIQRGESINLFDISGRKLQELSGNSSIYRIQLPFHGLYIIKQGELTQKVLY